VGTVDEVMKMGADEQLLLIEGGTPTRFKQVRYYERETVSVW
jgi:type IV secretory pathway TraG/TraD family ATPase VirD4